MNRYTYDLLEHLKTMYLRVFPLRKGLPRGKSMRRGFPLRLDSSTWPT